MVFVVPWHENENVSRDGCILQGAPPSQHRAFAMEKPSDFGDGWAPSLRCRRIANATKFFDVEGKFHHRSIDIGLGYP